MWLETSTRLALAAPPADRVDDVAAPDGVEARQRLVENEDIWVVRDRLRDAKPLFHASAERRHAAFGHALETHLRERFARARCRVRLVETVKAQEVFQLVNRAHARMELFFLRHELEPRVNRGIGERR